MDTTTQTVTTKSGWFAHYTMDGITTLCGKPASRTLEGGKASCRVCQARAGERPTHKR